MVRWVFLVAVTFFIIILIVLYRDAGATLGQGGDKIFKGGTCADYQTMTVNVSV